MVLWMMVVSLQSNKALSISLALQNSGIAAPPALLDFALLSASSWCTYAWRNSNCSRYAIFLYPKSPWQAMRVFIGVSARTSRREAAEQFTEVLQTSCRGIRHAYSASFSAKFCRLPQQNTYSFVLMPAVYNSGGYTNNLVAVAIIRGPELFAVHSDGPSKLPGNPDFLINFSLAYKGNYTVQLALVAYGLGVTLDHHNYLGNEVKLSRPGENILDEFEIQTDQDVPALLPCSAPDCPTCEIDVPGRWIVKDREVVERSYEGCGGSIYLPADARTATDACRFSPFTGSPKAWSALEWAPYSCALPTIDLEDCKKKHKILLAGQCLLFASS